LRQQRIKPVFLASAAAVRLGAELEPEEEET
jgi:hypothetical protein